MNYKIKKFQSGGGVTSFNFNGGTGKKVKGDPYEYAFIGGKYNYRKAGSSDQWTAATGNASEAIRTNVFQHQTLPEMRQASEEINPIQYNVSRQGEIKQLTPEQMDAWKQSDRKDKFLETIGWQTKAGKPGLVQGLAKTVGVSGVGAVVGAYTPWLAAGYSASQLPKDYEYVKYAYTDKGANTADKVVAPIVAGLDVAGFVGGAMGTFRQAQAAIPAGRSSNLVEQQKIFDPYINAGSQKVKPRNTVVQSSKVKPQGTSSVVTGRGRGNVTTIPQRPGQTNWSAPSSAKGTFTGREAYIPQSPFWAAGNSPDHTPTVTVPFIKPAPTVQKPETRTEIKTPNTWGSSEFQQAFRKARNANLTSFIFRGKSYTTDMGAGKSGKRYIAKSSSSLPEGEITNPNVTADIVPDSTKSISYTGKTTAKRLKGGIKGNPKTERKKVSDLNK